MVVLCPQNANASLDSSALKTTNALMIAMDVKDTVKMDQRPVGEGKANDNGA